MSGDGKTGRVGVPGAGGKYLSFYLNDEEYGVRIANVHEIIALMPVTRVPRTPDVVLGVINLRGKIVPVFDLHKKFGMPPAEATRHTCIIVVSVSGCEIGVVVDRVREVVMVAEDQIEPAPSFGPDVSTDHLVGIGTAGGSARLLLAIERVLSTSEVLQATAVTKDAAPAARVAAG